MGGASGQRGDIELTQERAIGLQAGMLASGNEGREIVDWLKQDYGLGRGHAMALVHVIKNGPGISEKHVGSSGTHRDESDTMYLDGIAERSREVARAKAAAR